jgi:hypothetical protein
MSARTKAALTAMLLALIVLAGCATTSEELPEYDTNQDGVISDEEYQEAAKKEDLLTTRQSRTSMRNRDATEATKTGLYGVNTSLNVVNSILHWIRW